MLLVAVLVRKVVHRQIHELAPKACSVGPPDMKARPGQFGRKLGVKANLAAEVGVVLQGSKRRRRLLAENLAVVLGVLAFGGVGVRQIGQTQHGGGDLRV